mmetsp:Transcript_71145/g.203984  ORF Transcript_71145/g.203984 Transcript_71145/m.203984 type:complete len:785 (+) Transcript_71145:39-2393(+)
MMREQSSAGGEDEEIDDEDAQKAGGAEEEEVEEEEFGTPGGCDSSPRMSKMPSKVPSMRTLRSRHGNSGSSSPWSPDRRAVRRCSTEGRGRLGVPGDRRLRQLRFNLDASPLRLGPSDPPPPPPLSQRLLKVGGCALSWIVAGGFGLTLSYFVWGGVLWFLKGRGTRFRDNFDVDGNRDGQWSMDELLSSVFLFSGVALLAFVFAKAALAIHYYTWFGLRATRQNRRAAELQKNSPFFISKVNSGVDVSMLEYLQTNYDSGPATPLVPTPVASSERGFDDELRSRTMSALSSVSSRRPSLRRDISDTQRSASEYMSLEARSSDNLCYPGDDTDESEDDAPKEPPATSSSSKTLQLPPGSTGNATTRQRAAIAASNRAVSQVLRQSSKGSTGFSGELSSDSSKKLQEMIYKLADWNFDIFEVAEMTQRPLSFVGFVCLDAYSKLVDFDKPKLVEFLREIEGSYRKVPYHNSLHGASVARCVYSFCAGCGLAFTQEYMEFTIVLAGLVHDVHHPGLTPAFLSKASMDGEWLSPITPPLEEADMELSLKYNDQSPLENMHCAITFQLLTQDRTGFLPKDEVMAMRKPLVRAILGTDMAKHAETMTRLAALIDNLEHEGESVAVPWHWPAKPPATADEEQRAMWERLYQEEFIMELFLHAADIGNPTLPFPQWVKWNRLVQREFNDQGDRELAEFGELISPPAGFDRNSTVMAEHAFTKGFMQYLCLPLFQKLHDLTQLPCPSSVCRGVNISGCLDNLKKNIEAWEDYKPRREATEPREDDDDDDAQD